MDIGAGLWKIVKEGTGVGVQQRLAQVILTRSCQRAPLKASILQQFLGSASATVSRFGPAWAKREIRARPIGAWLLACCWILGAVLLAPLAVMLG
jgi:hypothetical protein